MPEASEKWNQAETISAHKIDFNMTNEEIEKELEKEQLIDNDINELTELNKQIEKELEEYIEIDDKDNKGKKKT